MGGCEAGQRVFLRGDTRGDSAETAACSWGGLQGGTVRAGRLPEETKGGTACVAAGTVERPPREDPLSPHELRGKTRQMEAWTARGEKSAERLALFPPLAGQSIPLPLASAPPIPCLSTREPSPLPWTRDQHHRDLLVSLPPSTPSYPPSAPPCIPSPNPAPLRWLRMVKPLTTAGPRRSEPESRPSRLP